MENHPIVRETIRNLAFILRGEKVILDKDLAQLFGIETKHLNEAVSRNIVKFPREYMFQLSQLEYDEILKSQFATSRWGGTRRALPHAFTKRGIVMLATLLRSERAVSMAFEIVEVFVAVDEYLATHKHLAEKIAQIEGRLGTHSELIKDILDQLRRMVLKPLDKPKKFGFKKDELI